MNGLTKEQFKIIGMGYILDELTVITPYGKKELNSLKPFYSVQALENELNILERVHQVIVIEQRRKELTKVLSRFKNVLPAVRALSISKTLDDVEFFELKLFMMLYEKLKVTSKDLPFELSDIDFTELINRLDPEGQKLTSFSIYDVCDSRLNGLIARKRMIEHAISKGESDLSKRQAIVLEEKEQEQVILRELTAYFIPHVDLFIDAIDLIGKMDMTIAKAELIKRFNLVRPIMDSKAFITINGRHLETEAILENKGSHFVPLSVTLEEGVTFVTGANMGGKSVGMKALIQCQLMAQYGFYVPAEHFESRIMDYVSIINQDDQSIEKGLSTFGAEIMELKEIIDRTESGYGLIFLDELASGTNPMEAVKLVRAVADHLSHKQAMTVISTHYDGVVVKGDCHYEVVGLKDFDFDCIDCSDERRLAMISNHMDYRWMRVTEDTRVPKDAIMMCQWLGLQGEILKRCKED